MTHVTKDQHLALFVVKNHISNVQRPDIFALARRSTFDESSFIVVLGYLDAHKNFFRLFVVNEISDRDPGLFIFGFRVALSASAPALGSVVEIPIYYGKDFRIKIDAVVSFFWRARRYGRLLHETQLVLCRAVQKLNAAIARRLVRLRDYEHRVVGRLKIAAHLGLLAADHHLLDGLDDHVFLRQVVLTHEEECNRCHI